MKKCTIHSGFARKKIALFTKKITLLILSQSELWSDLNLYYFTLVVLLLTGNIGLQADETVWPGPEGDEDEV